MNVANIVGKILTCLVIVYFAAWSILFLTITEGEFALVGKYFVYGWTGGGEIPTVIQGLSSISAVGVTLLYGAWLWLRRRAERRK